MEELGKIQEHQEVIGSDGGLVGRVDHVEGDRLKLTKKDSADGQHHYLDASYVRTVNEMVHLSVSAEEARAAFSLQ